MEYAVTIHQAVRTFGATRAVDGVDLQIPKNSVYALLGPNGAGKTTLVRMIATLLRPTSGEIMVFGKHVVRRADEVRRDISLTGQFASLDEELTGSENMRMLTRLYGYRSSGANMRADELLEAFGLLDAGSRQVKNYSGGMRRRLDIAASLVVQPRIICLDEPTTGLDPRSRNMVWTVVRQLAASGTTVLLTTQYLEEADQLSDRIAVIDRGRIIAEGTSGELKQLIGSAKLHIRLHNAGERERALEVLETVEGVTIVRDIDSAALSCDISGTVDGYEVLGKLVREGIAVDEFSFGRPSLDDVFFMLTREDPSQL